MDEKDVIKKINKKLEEIQNEINELASKETIEIEVGSRVNPKQIVPPIEKIITRFTKQQKK